MNESLKIIINQSCAILIDGNNIEMSLQSLVGNPSALVDFDKLIPKLLQNRGLSRLIYFREGVHISEKLAERLLNQFHGSVIPCHKSADIPLTIKATQIAQKVDTIIILSGDSDYVELVRHLRGEGVRVEIAAIRQTTAKILIEEADLFTPITEEDCYILKSYNSQNTTKTSSKSTSKSSTKTTSKKSDKKTDTYANTKATESKASPEKNSSASSRKTVEKNTAVKKTVEKKNTRRSAGAAKQDNKKTTTSKKTSAKTTSGKKSTSKKTTENASNRRRRTSTGKGDKS